MASQEARKKISLVIFEAAQQFNQQVQDAFSEAARTGATTTRGVAFDATPFVDQILEIVAEDRFSG
jgi:hypothetical protein